MNFDKIRCDDSSRLKVFLGHVWRSYEYLEFEKKLQNNFLYIFINDFSVFVITIRNLKQIPFGLLVKLFTGETHGTTFDWRNITNVNELFSGKTFQLENNLPSKLT